MADPYLLRETALTIVSVETEEGRLLLSAADEIERLRAVLAKVQELLRRDTPHSMLCGASRGGCFRPSCSCWCHMYPNGVISTLALRAAIGGDGR